MKKYTHSLAFIFNPEGTHVALIEKQRPAWQKGLWNGLGGKVEPGETIMECVLREVDEESGIKTKDKDWKYVGDLTSQDWHVGIYAMQLRQPYYDLHSDTGEKTAWIPKNNLPEKIMDNLHWLIPLCTSVLHTNPDLQSITAKYDSTNRK